MATKQVNIFEEQTGITGTSDGFMLEANAQMSAVCSGSGSAKLQITIDPHNSIEADTATWIDAAGGTQASTFAESSTAPITGVRLVASSGTWALKVLQVTDTDKRG